MFRNDIWKKIWTFPIILKNFQHIFSCIPTFLSSIPSLFLKIWFIHNYSWTFPNIPHHSLTFQHFPTFPDIPLQYPTFPNIPHHSLTFPYIPLPTFHTFLPFYLYPYPPFWKYDFHIIIPTLYWKCDFYIIILEPSPIFPCIPFPTFPTFLPSYLPSLFSFLKILFLHYHS